MEVSPGRDAADNGKQTGVNGSQPNPLPYNERRIPDFVWVAEKEYLHERRLAAGKNGDDDTLGLALSGGGIRSASFNLGLVQALMAREKFQDIDYLSTVSGGGYLGGFLGARMADLRQPESNSEGNTRAELSYQDYVIPHKTGEQKNSVKRLLRSGRYLKRVPHFINKYLFGVAIVNLWLFFGLAAVGAGVAWAFRLIDSRVMINLAKAGGFASDISRAFLPAIFCFLLWMGVWFLRYFVQVVKDTVHTPILDAVTRVLAIFMLVLVALGIVSVLVTQDISLPMWSSIHEAAPEMTDAFHSLAIFLVILQLIALLPLLRLDKLIQSGTQPRGLRDSLIFNVVGPAIVFGIPLLAFGWFARENVSGAVENARSADFQEMKSSTDATVDQIDPRLLCFPHISNWEGFWTMIQQRAAAGRPLEIALLVAANPEPATDDVQASINIAKAYDQKLAGLYPLLSLVHVRETFPLCKKRDVSQRTIVNRINRTCLVDPALFKGVFLIDPPTSHDKRAFADWLARAEALSNLSPANRPGGEVANVNRHALQAYFGSQWLKPPETVFALTTLWADQRYRLFWCGAWALLWLLMGLFLNPNLGSLQEFYRERLQSMWLPRRKVTGKDRKKLLLSAIGHPVKGGADHDFPYLIINATAHVFRGDIGTFLGGEPDKRPRQTRFEFAPAFCGYSYETQGETSATHWFQPTSDYEQQPNLDLPGIMAISGSAVSPAMTENFVLKTLLFLSNFRLGQWVQQPEGKFRRLKYPKLLPCLCQMVFPLRHVPKYVFLSDGGHYDNLGLEALLDRRVRRIICVDAGHDPDGRFIDFLKLLRRSRFLDGVRIKTAQEDELGFAVLSRVKGNIVGAHFFEADIAYPDGSEGKLYYVKPSFDMDEPADLITYREENADFPHDPTLDQFYDERRFESYRALGWHIGEKLVGFLTRDTERVTAHVSEEPAPASVGSDAMNSIHELSGDVMLRRPPPR